MSSRRHTSPATGPLEDDDLLAEILLRLPPKPSSLPRASLVCKRWRNIALAAAFRRRFLTHHRKRPVLGAFLECDEELKFIPLLDPPDRISSERFSLDLSANNIFSWRVLGCRHGRVLLLNGAARVLLVFEPVSGGTHLIFIPPLLLRNGMFDANAAVLCAAGDDHVHGDCHTSPFKVVVIGSRERHQPALACVYSSETGIWGDVAFTAEPCTSTASTSPCVLIGSALYCRLNSDGILEFDLDNQNLTLIKPPVCPVVEHSWYNTSGIIRAEDGSLGFAIVSYPSIQLWNRKVDCHGVSTWVPRKNVNMKELLGPEANSAHLVGYAEDADVIFMTMKEAGDPSGYVLVSVQLESMKVEIHRGHGCFYTKIYHPLTNFYTAGTARA